jgi:hypothetical protein
MPGKGAFRVAAGAVAVLALGLGTTSAAAAAPAASSWHPGFSGVAGLTTAVTGVRAGGVTTEFAFASNSAPKHVAHTMYMRTNGGAWRGKSIPGMASLEEVVAAKALTANNLVVFTANLVTGTSRVLSYNAGRWHVARKFAAQIDTATVLSGSDMWVFGARTITGASKPLGVWHYDGKTWKRVAAAGVDGAGVSATSAWAVHGTSVERYAAGKWTATNLASLIPLGGFGGKSLIGVIPTSATTAYAVGSGNAEDAGGPIVVLRFNGHTWTKLATFSHGIVGWEESAIASDGMGGLFIGGAAGAGSAPQLLHYAKGSGNLVAESVPSMTNGTLGSFTSIANVPGTTTEIAGGYTFNAHTGTTIAKVSTTN